MILLFSCQSPLKFSNDIPLNLQDLFDHSSSQFPPSLSIFRDSSWEGSIVSDRHSISAL